MYEFFARYHEPAAEADLSVEQIDRAQNFTDTAVLVLGRDSGGEECDRHFRGDYGLIDLSWSLRYPAVKSILFMGIPGQEGAAALADILICAGGSYSPAPGTDCGVEDGSAFL
ncbi:MAG TPA: hypothetical protein DCZ91_20795 [Lachnospiraceae bacterium]|nr:hypothetical protein [Lachnospiraceae bacterium]